MDPICSQTEPTIGPRGIVTATAKEAVLVANSASFLLDRLRKDVSVRYVIENMQLADIVKTLKVGLDNPPTDPTSLVSLYVYLVALSATDPLDRDTWKQIESLDLSGLEWGSVIRALISADAIPTTTMEVTLPSPVKPL
jgi:hypothetical protein